MIPELDISDVKVIRPLMHRDERGWFCEVFNEEVARLSSWPNFVQENESFSSRAGTVRGLHFQRSPFAQAKLVRCIRGAILDIAVDIRPKSPTYGSHVAIQISDRDRLSIYVPVGFAHGFCTLEPETVVQYKVSARYNRDAEGGLAWNDPALGIKWPVDHASAILSQRDRLHPVFAALNP